jgi:hypothetical protein
MNFEKRIEVRLKIHRSIMADLMGKGVPAEKASEEAAKRVESMRERELELAFERVVFKEGVQIHLNNIKS